MRLRDAKSRPVQCYKCGGSSIPTRSLASDLGAQWRPIVSCDYCNLHWHLDCLSPPLASMPSASRKWMCPNHSDQVMPRRRTVRNGLETVDVETPGAHNNGNVVVVEAQETQEALPHDDMLINNRRYRVPERVIQLDFWNKLKLGQGRREAPAKTAAKERRAREAFRNATREDLEAASLILGLGMGAGDDGEGEGEESDGEGNAGDASGAPPIQASTEQAVTTAPARIANGTRNGTRSAAGTPTPAPPRPASADITMADASAASPSTRLNGVTGKRTRRSPLASPNPNANTNGNGASPAGSPAPGRPGSNAGDGPRRITLRLTQPS